MRYPIVIEEGTGTAACGVVVPDLPGCFSAGDTLDEAMANVEEAAAAWIDATLDAGDAVPPPSSLEDVKKRPEFTGWAFGVVIVDPASFDDTPTRINVSLPVRVIKRLDAKIGRATCRDRVCQYV